MERVRNAIWAARAAALVFVFFSVVQAEPLQGRMLLQMLTGNSDSSLQTNLNRARAMGYLQGMQESYLVAIARDPSMKLYCLPSTGVSSARLRDIVVRWLQNHPERLEEPAMLLVFHALADEFPCQ